MLPYSQYLGRLPGLPAAARHGEQRQVGRPRRQPGRRARPGPIVWGQPGTNGQHAFYQLIHQGTKLIPCDFIGFVRRRPRARRPPGPADGQLLRPDRGAGLRQDAPTRSRPRACPRRQVPHRTFAGNHPTNTILARRLTPHTLGQLVALYEHKVFTQGTIWDINSFDQWGVELGKKLAQKIIPELEARRRPDPAEHDSSTSALIRRYRARRYPGEAGLPTQSRPQPPAAHREQHVERTERAQAAADDGAPVHRQHHAAHEHDRAHHDVDDEWRAPVLRVDQAFPTGALRLARAVGAVPRRRPHVRRAGPGRRPRGVRLPRAARGGCSGGLAGRPGVARTGRGRPRLQCGAVRT